jgi:hypothetical protein
MLQPNLIMFQIKLTDALSFFTNVLLQSQQATLLASNAIVQAG